MGILYSDIYKKYFPLKIRYTEFTEREKRVLCRWAKNFESDIHCREIQEAKNIARCGLEDCYIRTYDMSVYSADTIIDMITKNQFDEQWLHIINLIIYGHKYNFLLSCLPWFFFPMLTKERYEFLLNKPVK